MKRLLAIFLCLVLLCQPVAGFDDFFGEEAFDNEIVPTEEIVLDEEMPVEESNLFDEELILGEEAAAEEEMLLDAEVAAEEEILLDGEASFDGSAEEIIIDEAEELLSSEETDLFAEDVIILEEAEDLLGAFSGTCGENLTWTLDSEWTLTISGTGRMEDFDV